MQVADFQPGATYGPRLLPDYELVWLLHGSALWRTQTLDARGATVAEERHLLEPGTLALARRGTRDSYAWDTSRTSQHAYVHFKVVDPGRLGDDRTWPAIRTMSESRILDGLCSYLLELSLHESTWGRCRSDEMVELLLDLFVGGPVQPEKGELPASLESVVNHVWNVWRSDGLRIIPTEELAAAANLSTGHLHHLFRTRYQCGPARALELIRLGQAAATLQRSNASLAEVAGTCGFSNPYHFSRRFARTYGSPPGRFRQDEQLTDSLWPVREAGLLLLAKVLLRHGETDHSLV